MKIVAVSQKKKGESPIYRRIGFQKKFMQPPHGLKTMQQFWSYTQNKYRLHKCLENYTYSDIEQMANAFGSWLTLNNHKILYIHSKNRWEWALADITCLKYNIISIPLYDTLGKEAFQHTLMLTKGTVILSTSQIFKILSTFSETSLKFINTVIILQSPSMEKIKIYQKIQIIKLSQVLINKRIIPEPNIKPNDIMTIAFTSGTTGIPKGAILTHWNFITKTYANAMLFQFKQTDIQLSYLPLPHLFERSIQFTVLESGAQIRYLQGNTTQILQNLQRIQPTILPMVPRLFNLFYSMLKNSNQMNNQIAEKAYKLKTQFWLKGINYTEYDQSIFKKVIETFGGRIRFMITGSAPISAEVLNFFRIILGCDIRQGYGQTQSTAGTFGTSKNQKTAGHVGLPHPTIQFKLVDIPQMQYFTDKNPSIGQLCVRGHTIFTGYYNNQQMTKEALDSQGFLHTGDVGYLDQNGFMRLIDRKKNIYKLSQGQYIAPQKLENVYMRCQLIAQILIYGDSMKDYNIGVIFPKQQLILEYAKNKKIEENFEKLCTNPVIVKYVLEQITQIAKKNGLFGFEIAKKIILLPRSFATYGMMTSTMKIQRGNTKKIFGKLIQDLYNSK